MRTKISYYYIIVPLKYVFFWIMFENWYFYRKLKGGIWVNYFPRMYPYMSLWTRGRLYIHEIECRREDHGEIIIRDKVLEHKKKRKYQNNKL